MNKEYYHVKQQRDDLVVQYEGWPCCSKVANQNICSLQPHVEDLKITTTKIVRRCATFKFTKE
jgi:hypothetical protein